MTHPSDSAPLYLLALGDHVELSQQKPVRGCDGIYVFPARKDILFSGRDGTLKPLYKGSDARVADAQLRAELVRADAAIAEAEDRLLAARDAHHALLVAAIDRCPLVPTPLRAEGE